MKRKGNKELVKESGDVTVGKEKKDKEAGEKSGFFEGEQGAKKDERSGGEDKTEQQGHLDNAGRKLGLVGEVEEEQGKTARRKGWRLIFGNLLMERSLFA